MPNSSWYFKQYLLSFVHVIIRHYYLSNYPMFRITTADILYVFHVLVMFCKNNFLYDLPLPWRKVHIVWAKILKIYDTYAGLLKKSAIKRLTIGNWILLLMYGCKKKCAYLANTPPHQFLRYARKNISVFWCCFKIIEYLCARKRYCFLKTNRLRLLPHFRWGWLCLPLSRLTSLNIGCTRHSPSKLDSALVCTIFRDSPSKLGLSSRCSIGF